MDIGSKIKEARINANYTQEKAADELCVSRQTISNWETGKTYPDIMSVIKISDLYNISLDCLLKDSDKENKEATMNEYVNYLNESTNTVKSKERLAKMILIISYVLILAIGMIEFWVFLEPGNEMGYSIVYIIFLLPLMTLLISLILGLNNYWDKLKWYAPIVFGFGLCASDYFTFQLSNSLQFHQFNYPELSLIVGGIVVSLIGLGIGTLFRKLKQEK